MDHPLPTLNELVELSRWLGAPERDGTILGEGNTSARLDERTFLVKASGTELATIGAGGFVEVRRAEVLAMLAIESDTGGEAHTRLATAKADPNQPGVPSVETPLHAVCLGLPGVRYVGHTHPTAINAITCSRGFDDALSQRLFPDQVIACGPRSLRVPAANPGFDLGRALSQSLEEYLDHWGEPPKTIYLRNHGFVALGSTPREVKALTQMAIKAARILAGTMSFGGPNSLEAIDKDHYHP